MDESLPARSVLLDQVADKWTILILATLCNAGGKARFNTVLKALPDISQKILSQCLRRLERNGIVRRTVLNTVPVGVEYSITKLGHTLEGPFNALHDWSATYLSEVELAQREYDDRRSVERRDQPNGSVQ